MVVVAESLDWDGPSAVRQVVHYYYYYYYYYYWGHGKGALRWEKRCTEVD